MPGAKARSASKGLDIPGIHAFKTTLQQEVDGRDNKPGHDGKRRSHQ
jgi:hypothetical protein